MFSKSCEYGIRATLYVAEQSQKGERVSLKSISKATDTPEAFTAKILQQLVKKGIINSMKGPTGGFQINCDNLESIMLSQIVDAIDGDDVYRGCGLGLKKCDALNPCPAHDHFVKIREKLRNMLETTSIKILTAGLNEGKYVLKR
ncbi:MAG: Rrf2 family transcriptional regulator [Crocinitomicaceae bacterium]|nr:Rrf2 family transcriptional regulator [Crocinitomicaceae bacterium]